jgi:hypothetical protein
MTVPVPVSATASLAAAKLPGPGATVDFSTPKRNVSQVIVVSGAITGGLVALEASHDGVSWVSHTVVDVSQGINLAVDNRYGAYRFWRSNMITPVTGAGSVTTTFMEAG